MNKFKKITRYIIPVLSYLFLTGLFFSAGYLIGIKSSNEIMTVNPTITATEKPQTVDEAVSVETKKHYRVILEDGHIRLYIDEKEKSHLLSNDTISEAAYPGSDITKLKEGVIFSELSEALLFMENFLS